MSIDARYIKEEPNPYGIKECYVVLKQLIPSVCAIKQEPLKQEPVNQESIHAIKQEQLSDEECSFQDGFAKNDSLMKDFAKELGALQDEFQPKLEVKVERTINERSCTGTDQEVWSEGTESENYSLSTQQFISDHFPYQCIFCNFVFGIKSSFTDHEKNCKESFNMPTDTKRRKKNATKRENQFVCCGEPYTVFQHFNSHKFSVHGIEFLVCGLCDKEEISPLALYNHYIDTHFSGCNTLLNYPKLKLKKIKKKSKKIEKKKNSATDVVTHSQNDKLLTKKLNPDDSQNDKLLTKKLNSDNLPYRCTSCNYVFGMESSFTDHKKTCEKSLNIPSVLCSLEEEEERKELVNESKFVCCGKIFKYFHLFNSHKFYVHLIEYLVCGLCKKEEETPLWLYKHYINNHFPECNTELYYKISKKKESADSFVESSIDEVECTAVQEGVLCQCSNCNKKVSIDTSVCKPYVESSIDEVECTAVQEGVLCQCSKCNKKVSIDTSVCKPYVKSLRAEVESPEVQDGVLCQGSTCDRKVSIDTPVFKRHVKSSRAEVECTAVQEGVLCQCSTCNKKFSIDTSVSKPYVCKICNSRFSRKDGLKTHMQRIHTSERYSCDICTQYFTSPYTVKRHKLTHHSSDGSPFKMNCNICFKQLSSKKALSQHVRNVHLKLNIGKRLPCPHCPKTCAPRTIKRHIQRHLKESQYICDYCNKIYYVKYELINHIHTKHFHHEPLKCDICGRSYQTVETLRAHKLNKHSNGTYTCEICGKTRETKQFLKKHMISHSNERPFVCQTCGKAFKRENNLVQHQYSHSSARPHICDICGQSFRLWTHVKQHMAVHGLGDNHKCLICNEFFARKTELRVHMSVHEALA